MFHSEWTASEGPNSSCTVSMASLARRRSHNKSWQEGERQQTETETGEVPLETGKYFYYDGSQAVEQVVQRGCVVSSLGGFQDQTGPSPEQLGLTSGLILLRATGWTRDLLGPFPTGINVTHYTF